MASPDDCLALQSKKMTWKRDPDKQKPESASGDVQGRSGDGTNDIRRDNVIVITEEEAQELRTQSYILSDYEGDEKLMEQYRLMDKQFKESNGFDVDIVPDRRLAGICSFLLPMDLTDGEDHELLDLYKCLFRAIDLHNDKDEVDEKLEFVEVNKALVAGSSFREFFVTFKVQVISSGEYKIYQTKVRNDFLRQDIRGYLQAQSCSALS